MDPPSTFGGALAPALYPVSIFFDECNLSGISHQAVNVVSAMQYVLKQGSLGSGVFTFDYEVACAAQLDYQLEVTTQYGNPITPSWINVDSVTNQVYVDTSDQNDVGVYTVKVKALLDFGTSVSEDSFSFPLTILHNCEESVISLGPIPNIIVYVGGQVEQRTLTASNTEDPDCGSPVFTITPAITPALQFLSSNVFEFSVVNVDDYFNWISVIEQMSVKVVYAYKEMTFSNYFTIQVGCLVQSLTWSDPFATEIEHYIFDPDVTYSGSINQNPACGNAYSLSISPDPTVSHPWLSFSPNINSILIAPTDLNQSNDLLIPAGEVFTIQWQVDSAIIQQDVRITLYDPCRYMTLTKTKVSPQLLNLLVYETSLSNTVLLFERAEQSQPQIDCLGMSYEIMMQSSALYDSSIFVPLTSWISIDSVQQPSTLSFDFGFMQAINQVWPGLIPVQFRNGKDIGAGFEFKLKSWLTNYPQVFSESNPFQISIYSMNCEADFKDSVEIETNKYKIGDQPLEISLFVSEYPDTKLAKSASIEIFDEQNNQVESDFLTIKETVKVEDTLSEYIVTVESDKNSDAGKFKVYLVILFTDFSVKRTCSFDLVVLERPSNFTSILEPVSFHFGQFQQPDPLTCSGDDDWTYKLPEIQFDDPQDEQVKVTIGVNSDKLEKLIVHDQYENKLFAQSKEIKKFDSGMFLIDINLRDSKGRGETYQLTVQINCPKEKAKKPYKFVMSERPLIPRITNIKVNGEVTVTFNTTGLIAPSSFVLSQDYDSEFRQLDDLPDYMKYINPTPELQYFKEGKPKNDFKNFTQVHNSTVLIEQKEYPALELYIERGQDSEKERLDFQWEVTEFNSVGFKMQLMFNEPLYVSAWDDPEVLYMKFNGQELFKDTDNQYIYPQIEIRQVLPRQMSPEMTETIQTASEVVSTAIQTSLVSNFVANFMLQVSLSSLFNAINNLQIITHCALVNLVVPPATQEFYGYLFAIVAFEVISISDKIDDILGQENKGALTNNFLRLGYESNYFLTNMGSILVFLPGTLLTIILMACGKRFCFCSQKLQGIFERQLKQTFFNRIIRMIEEIYIIIAVSMAVNIRQTLNGSIDNNVSFKIAGSMIFLLLGYPLSIAYLYTHDKDKLDQDWFKEKYGELYNNVLNYKKQGRLITVCILSAIIRKALFAYILVYGLSVSTIQLQAVLQLVIIHMILLALTEPYIEKDDLKVEIISELVTIAIIYHLFYCTDFVNSVWVKTIVGYSLNAITLAYIIYIVQRLLTQAGKNLIAKIRRKFYERRVKLIIQQRMEQKLAQNEVRKCQQSKELANQSDSKMELRSMWTNSYDDMQKNWEQLRLYQMDFLGTQVENQAQNHENLIHMPTGNIEIQFKKPFEIGPKLNFQQTTSLLQTYGNDVSQSNGINSNSKSLFTAINKDEHVEQSDTKVIQNFKSKSFFTDESLRSKYLNKDIRVNNSLNFAQVRQEKDNLVCEDDQQHSQLFTTQVNLINNLAETPEYAKYPNFPPNLKVKQRESNYKDLPSFFTSTQLQNDMLALKKDNEREETKYFTDAKLQTLLKKKPQSTYLNQESDWKPILGNSELKQSREALRSNGNADVYDLGGKNFFSSLLDVQQVSEKDDIDPRRREGFFTALDKNYVEQVFNNRR